jgi:dTDP-4-amino-4,6-dideoxygalactose transaminase
MPKRSLDELAVFGGRPAFSRPLHVGRPNIGDRDRLMARLESIVDNRWLTNNGSLVQEFEKRTADLAGVRHCIATCNATVALEIAIRATGLQGEVIVPSFTFVATAHAVQWLGLTPLFCDIAPGTHTIDPERVEALITPRTSGIIGVHLWGQPCAIDELTRIATRHRLALLFDAAHACGCSYHGRPVGGFGLAEVMSFHATKIVNAAEGGAILTDHDELAEKARRMRNFGFSGLDSVVDLGTNGKMSEVSAAFGLTNLESLETFIGGNRASYERYRQGLTGIPGLSLLAIDDRTDRRNFQYVVVEVDEARAGVDRDDLVRLLTAENVLARRYFWPGCHRMEPYRSLFPEAGRLLPVTERVAARVMTLPTGMSISPDDVDAVCELIRLAVSNGAEVAGRLRRAERRG